MKSIDERLADANPVSEGYLPPAYEQMLTRAMSQARHRDPVWRTFRLRVGGSVAAVSALTVLGVSALNGAGSALPVLGFSASAATPAASSTSAKGVPTQGEFMVPRQMNYVFTGGDAFSSDGGSAPVYALSTPSDVHATLESVAATLGVTLATTAVNQGKGYYDTQGDG